MFLTCNESAEVNVHCETSVKLSFQMLVLKEKTTVETPVVADFLLIS